MKLPGYAPVHQPAKADGPLSAGLSVSRYPALISAHHQSPFCYVTFRPAF
ncbi:hypothetical protein CSC17_5043 [Klebsiella oxytoca]|nr:hypothetical protein CSC17_5043 [Klebsiella oxytoca]